MVDVEQVVETDFEPASVAAWVVAGAVVVVLVAGCGTAFGTAAGIAIAVGLAVLVGTVLPAGRAAVTVEPALGPADQFVEAADSAELEPVEVDMGYAEIEFGIEVGDAVRFAAVHLVEGVAYLLVIVSP